MGCASVASRFSPLWLCLFLVLYPGIFVPLTMFFAWPIVIETDFTTYVKSDTPASVQYDAASAAYQQVWLFNTLHDFGSSGTV